MSRIATPSIDAVVDEFTNRGSNIATASEYLLSALRTGIFDQGGPALGTLARSERNRSRREMEMPGHREFARDELATLSALS